MLKYYENDNEVKATHWKPSQISQTLKKNTPKQNQSPGIQALKHLLFLNTFGQIHQDTSPKIFINLRKNNFFSKMTINISTSETTTNIYD